MIVVHDAASIAVARGRVRSVAAELGFPAVDTEAMAIVVSELGTNQLRHAHEGRIDVRAVKRGDTVGLEIEAIDRGPGLADPVRAFAGESSKNLGIGLPAVQRQCSEVDLGVELGGGTRLVVRRFAGAVARRPCVASVGRPLAAEPRSGDRAAWWRTDDALLVALVDGLGHGPLAREAADVVVDAVGRAPGRPVAELVAAAADAARGTRAGVLALARLGAGKLEYAGVGNIALLWRAGAGAVERATLPAGVLGAPGQVRVRAHEVAVPRHLTLVLASDGVRDPGVDLPVEAVPPWDTAWSVLRRRARDTDDATVLVVR